MVFNLPNLFDQQQIEVTDLAPPLWVQKIVEGANFVRLDHFGVVPNALGKLGLEHLNASFGVIDP